MLRLIREHNIIRHISEHNSGRGEKQHMTNEKKASRFLFVAWRNIGTAKHKGKPLD